MLQRLLLPPAICSSYSPCTCLPFFHTSCSAVIRFGRLHSLAKCRGGLGIPCPSSIRVSFCGRTNARSLILDPFFSDGRPPYALVSLPKLVSQQPYDVSLHLTIPATDSNYALGNFMTTLTISTPSNQTLASVRRPVSQL